jgi:hypothetical protein
MRSIRSLLGILGTILLLTLFAPAAAASSGQHPDSHHRHSLHISKDCSTFSGAPGAICTITASNLPAIPAGTIATYLGPTFGPDKLDSTVVLDAGFGNTATGRCKVGFATFTGKCTFSKGTGSLAGLHAKVKVTVDATGLWHWDGSYSFTRKVSRLHIAKDCSTFSGAPGAICTITSSSLPAIPAGTIATYFGPTFGPDKLDSKVVLDAGLGNTATGHCTVAFATLTGKCHFTKGTGSLAGFHARVKVTVDSTGLWHWDGTFHYHH